MALDCVLHVFNDLVFLLIALVYLLGLFLLVHFLGKRVTLAVRWVHFHILLHEFIRGSAHRNEWFKGLVALVKDGVGVNVHEDHLLGFLLDVLFLDSG